MSTNGDQPHQRNGRRSNESGEGDQFSRFEQLTRKLTRVPKRELDKKLEEDRARKR